MKCILIVTVILGCNLPYVVSLAAGPEYPVECLKFTCDDGASKEFVQFSKVAERRTIWLAIGFQGRLCGSGLIASDLAELTARVRVLHEEQLRLRGNPEKDLTVSIVGSKSVESFDIGPQEVKAFFGDEGFGDFRATLDKALKKPDRIQVILDRTGNRLLQVPGVIRESQMPQFPKNGR